MAERIDLLGRHYNVFMKECRRMKSLEKMKPVDVPQFMKLCCDYIREEMPAHKCNLPANLKVRRAVEHNSRY